MWESFDTKCACSAYLKRGWSFKKKIEEDGKWKFSSEMGRRALDVEGSEKKSSWPLRCSVNNKGSRCEN